MTDALRGIASRIGEWVQGMGGRALNALGFGGSQPAAGAAQAAPAFGGMPGIPMPGGGLPGGAPPPPPPPQPIVIQNQMTLDGRPVYESMSRHMANDASRPSNSAVAPDFRRTPQTPGAPPAR